MLNFVILRVIILNVVMLNVFMLSVIAENTKGEGITVLLTSCLTGLD